jgi:uncharacterized membrane protein
MSIQQVPAGNGLQWLTGAVNLILKNPVPFALMGLLVAVIAIVPILGSLALIVLGPALYGGIIYAAREQDAGRPADFQQLFQAFREEGKLGKMLMLCLPGIAAGVIIAVLGVIVLGGTLLGAGVSAASNSGAAVGAAMGVGGVIFVLVAIAVGAASYALTFFATPQVMLESAEPIAAMKQSLQACLANVGAVLLYLVVLLGIVIVLGMILGMIPFLGQLVLMTALIPVVCAASYLAWRQVYRRDVTQEIPPVAPPSPPGVEV